MPGAYKQMGDMNKNQPMKGYDHMQPGKISGGAAQYITQSMGATKPDPDSSKSSKPTDAEKAAYMKENANAPSPDFNPSSPLPEGSSDIGGEMVGKGRKVFVEGNFDNKKMVNETDLKNYRGNKEQLLNNKNTGLYSQSSNAKTRTENIETLTKSTPGQANQLLTDLQKSSSGQLYTGAGKEQAPDGYTKGDFLKENPSQRGNNSLYKDLKIKSYQPTPEFKPSGAPNLYAKKKN